MIGPLSKDPTWSKCWHDPHPGWPHERQRELGGWWKCRNGPDATDAENNCKPCSAPLPSGATDPVPDPATQLDELMKIIREAMAKVEKADKEAFKEDMATKNVKVKAEPNGNLGKFRPRDDNYPATEHDTMSFKTQKSWINYAPL